VKARYREMIMAAVWPAEGEAIGDAHALKPVPGELAGYRVAGTTWPRTGSGTRRRTPLGTSPRRRRAVTAGEKGGGPASPLLDADYPVVAACKICGGRIKLDHIMQMDWRHAPAGGAA
jgi:hypothetical protein